MCFGCEWTRGVWFVGQNGLKIERDKICKFDKWFFKVLSCKELLVEDKVWVPFTVWYTWKGRRDVSLEKKEVDNKGTVDKLTFAMNVVLGSFQFKNKIHYNVSCSADKSRALQEGFVKMNCDGAFKEATKEKALGIISLDVNGKMLGDGAKKVHVHSALRAEVKPMLSKRV